MTHYEGMYLDTILECDADSEEEAQQIMKRILLEMIMDDPDPLLVWEQPMYHKRTDANHKLMAAALREAGQ